MSMRKLFVSAVLSVAAVAADAATPSPLRVLYVGDNPQTVTLPGADRLFTASARVLELKKSRTPAFEKFLRQHFRTVKVVYADAYRETMSADYDVTIFDATPPVIKKSFMEKDPKTGRTHYEPAHYLTAGFDDAAILISEISPKISEPLEYKMDWLCLCLDAHAHGMKLDHPIFNTPHRIKPTIEYRPTPENYRTYFYVGRNLPDILPTWRVQLEGYLDGKGFPAGLVSSGPGFADAPDSEVISSGMNTKGGPDAVALGRHGNFFHWGFSAAPDEMTEEGRLAFVNAVHYIAKYKGQHPFSRRPYRSSCAREVALDSARTLVSADHYDGWAETKRQSHESRKKYLRQLQEMGRKLSPEELRTLDAPMPDLPDHEQWLKQEVLGRYQPDSVVALFGAELDKYLPYYEMNLEYLKPSEKPCAFEVDQDVRSLAVSNRDVQLLELCVALLESNVDTAKAQRILTRYTGENFQSPWEWRQWLDRHRGRLYFSDVDGFRFHVAPAPL